MIIEGSIAVKAAINSHKRKIEKIYIDSNKKTKDFNYIRKIAKLNNLEVLSCSSEEISALATGKSHGGVLAEVSNRLNDEIVAGDIFYLDGIEDPFNLGYAIRTLYAFGVNNLLLSNHDYSSMQAQLLKSSAGAYDMLNVSVLDNEEKTIRDLKSVGYTVYGLFRGEGSKDVFECAFDEKSLFILGGEKRGIKAELLKLCDDYLYIPYGSDFRNSLNATAALDCVATLLFKQRKK